jgi:hypothetical protein
MEVGDAVTSRKTAEYTGVMDWIGCGNIYNLKGHLECSTPLVSSNLQPDLIGWYKPFMPGKPVSSATMF